MKKSRDIKQTPRWLFPVIITVFVFLIYGNSIRNEYSLDDDIVTVTTPQLPDNPRIEKGIKGIPALFKTHYMETNKQSFDYRPLPLVTFAIEYQFFKSNPHIGHFINVLTYAFICVLLFFILTKLFNEYHLALPLLSTLFFISHPLHTEVVDSLKNRDELMSFLFALLSLNYALKYIEGKKIYFALLSVLFLTLAFLSKKTVIVFLLLIPLTLYFFRNLKLKVVLYFFLVSLVAFVLFTITKKSMLMGVPVKREFIFTENPLFFEKGFFNRIPSAFYTVGYYLKLMLIPFPLSAYYGYDVIPVANWKNVFVWVSVIIHFAAGIFALLNIKRKRVLSFGILFYLLSIAAFSNLVKPAVGIVADRFVITSSLGFCIIFAALILSVFKIPFENNKAVFKMNPLLIVLLMGVIGIYSGLTVSRNTKWKDALTLYRNDVKYFAQSSTLHFLLGNKLYSQVMNFPESQQKNILMNEAISHLKQAGVLIEKGIKKYPSDFVNSDHLGTIYWLTSHDTIMSQMYFEKALGVKSDYDEANYNLACCYLLRNFPDSAIKYYEKTISVNQKYLYSYFRLHTLYLEKGEFAKAIAIDEKSIFVAPNELKLYINLGNSYLMNNDTVNALICYEKSLPVSASDYELMAKIAALFKAIGNNSKAKVYEQKAQQINSTLFSR